MTKRRTIGDNPLDFVGTAGHLETVVPAAPTPREVKPGAPAAPDPRLDHLEAAIKQLRVALGDLRMEVADLKSQMFRDAYRVAQLKDKPGAR
jgi:hypothetical protein